LASAVVLVQPHFDDSRRMHGMNAAADRTLVEARGIRDSFGRHPCFPSQQSHDSPFGDSHSETRKVDGCGPARYLVGEVGDMSRNIFGEIDRVVGDAGIAVPLGAGGMPFRTALHEVL